MATQGVRHGQPHAGTGTCKRNGWGAAAQKQRGTEQWGWRYVVI